MATFIITTSVEGDKKVVNIAIEDNVTFADWVMACEFLLNKTAQLSPAGYEKAMELLCKGSMTYKTTLKAKGKNNGLN